MGTGRVKVFTRDGEPRWFERGEDLPFDDWARYEHDERSQDKPERSQARVT